MVQPNKKCINKKCDDCNFYVSWDMEHKNGLRQNKLECLFYVLAQEIPSIRGAIDGLQGGVNEARNRSIETKAKVENFGNAAHEIFNQMSQKFVNVLNDINNRLKLLE